MRVLLLNPWIVDVAAFNFWLRPLGLYILAEWLVERGAKVRLLDCLSPFKAPGKFTHTPFKRELSPGPTPPHLKRYGIPTAEFQKRLELEAFDAVLVTSAISYWYPGVLGAIGGVKAHNPKATVILGGVYPTLWPDHADIYSGADEVLPGSLEDNAEKLASLLGLPKSPIREKQPWWTLSLHDNATFSAVRANRGCPYHCTYCASNVLSPTFTPRTRDEIAAELLALWRLGVREVAFYDDALLVGAEENLFPAIAEARKKGADISFQTPNGLHARLLTEGTARKMVELGFKGFRLALETVDRERAKATGGKVYGEELGAAVRGLLGAGALPSSIGVYLMMGLPGQTVAEVEEGIAFVRKLGVRPYLSEYSPIPKTAEWEKALTAQSVTGGMDPMWTNNSLYLTNMGGWSEETLLHLKKAARGA